MDTGIIMSKYKINLKNSTNNFLKDRKPIKRKLSRSVNRHLTSERHKWPV